MGADAMYAPGPKSEEPYKDIQHPERFASLPVLFDDGLGNIVWSTQRRYPQRARVVNTARQNGLQAPRSTEDLEPLAAYVDLIENGPDSPVTFERPSTDSMVLHAKFDSGQSLLVQETWDPGWRASVDGTALPIRKDVLGFMVVDPPAGDRTVRMEFPMPLENRVGWGLTGLTVLALGVLAFRKERSSGGREGRWS
jgi:hypothetical protein